jgi:hypothetical protein
MVAKGREGKALSKQRLQGVHMERFNLNKLNDVEAKEQYCVEIESRFAALKNLDAVVDINSAGKLSSESESLYEPKIQCTTVWQLLRIHHHLSDLITKTMDMEIVKINNKS